MNGQSTIDSTEILVIVTLVLVAAMVIVPNLITPNFYVGLWMDFKVTELAMVTPVFNVVAPDWSVTQQLNYFGDRLSTLYPADVTWHSVLKIEYYSLIYRWPLIIPVIYLLYRSFTHKPENQGMLSFDELIELQTRKAYRFNRHLIKHNPQNDPDLDATKGIYAQRMKPLDYALYHRILTLNSDVTSLEEKKFDFHPDVAKEVMSKQLGSVYTGINSLGRAEKWMLAAFLLWLDMQTHEYHEFLGDMSVAMSHEDEELEQQELEEVDNKAARIIDELKEDTLITRTVRSNLSSEVIGSDTATVIRDLIEALAEKSGFDPGQLSFISELYPNEWEIIMTDDAVCGLPFYNIENVNPGYIAIAYCALQVAEDCVANANEKMTAKSAASKAVEGVKSEFNALDTKEPEDIDAFVTNASRMLVSRMDHSPAYSLSIAANSHNYTKGVLLRLYRMCGDLGVVCASRFTFIKLVDRELFFVLLDEGMPEGSTEVSFSRAHFDSEIEAGRKLSEPEVDHQINAIRNLLLERVDLTDEPV